MIGYHIYFQQDKKSAGNLIDFSAHLASILFWKEHYGPIRLYCNSNFLESIKEYNLDVLYDEINTEILDNIPNKRLLKKYWSYPKIYAANDIIKTESKFCIIDVDLWISNKFLWDESKDFIAFHYESFDLKYKHNPYLDPKLFLLEEDFNKLDWNILPINCSFMYINNTKLIETWYDMASKIVDLNLKVKSKSKDCYTLFIEQRLISVLCNDLNLNFDSLISNVFLTNLDYKGSTENWMPILDHSDPNSPSGSIKHIWGLKKFYNDPIIFMSLLEAIYADIHNSFGHLEMDFTKLYRERLITYQNEKNSFN
jgi:hypothetical protein